MARKLQVVELVIPVLSVQSLVGYVEEVDFHSVGTLCPSPLAILCSKILGCSGVRARRDAGGPVLISPTRTCLDTQGSKLNYFYFIGQVVRNGRNVSGLCAWLVATAISAGGADGIFFSSFYITQNL